MEIKGAPTDGAALSVETPGGSEQKKWHPGVLGRLIGPNVRVHEEKAAEYASKAAQYEAWEPPPKPPKQETGAKQGEESTNRLRQKDSRQRRRLNRLPHRRQLLVHSHRVKSQAPPNRA